jgi:ribosomal protein L11 methyltransferase
MRAAPGMGRHATALETISVEIPEQALEAYEAALASVCGTVGFFLDEATGVWVVEGVKERGESEAELSVSLALAAAATGVSPEPRRAETPAEGWLARTYSGFPEQLVGRRFAIRGTHLDGPPTPGRITLVLDAGVAFGSGEHGSTRGCLRALERVAYRRPEKILDLGTGSGVLAMAAARLRGRRVIGTDIDPWAVRVARDNARLNSLANRTRYFRADGWSTPGVRRGAPYDLVFANILARPLCRMARPLAAHLAPGGTAILAGLLGSQTRMVLAAHRRRGLRLEAELREGTWSTLILRRNA